MRFHIHHHHNYDNDVTQLLGQLMANLQDLQAKASAILTQVQNDTNINTAIAKVVDDYRSTISSLKQQLADAGQDQTKLQQLSDTMDAVLQTDVANSKIVADKVVDGTSADQSANPAPAPVADPTQTPPAAS